MGLVVLWAGLGCAASAPPPGGPKSAATAPAPAPAAAPPPAGAPAPGGTIIRGSLEQLFGRESSGLTPRPLEFSDGKFTAEVESSAAPTAKRSSESWAVTVPIGSALPISCYVYDKQTDGAATVVRFIRLIKEGTKDLTIKQVLPTEAGAVGEDPYMIAELVYSKAMPAGPVIGQIKMMVRPSFDAPLFCFHDEPGYTQTFKRVTLGLARALKARTPSPPPELVEIWVAHLGDMPVGYDKRTIGTDASGNAYDQTISCGLIPRSLQELSATDEVEVERRDAKGRVQQIDSVAMEGEEIESQLQLARQGAGREYTVKGKVSGKEISARFKSKEKEGLPSGILVASRLRALAAGKARELKVEEFHPSISPQQPIDVVYRSKDGSRDLTMTLGKIEATGHLDEHGMLDRSSVPLGGTVMRQERILIRGAP